MNKIASKISSVGTLILIAMILLVALLTTPVSASYDGSLGNSTTGNTGTYIDDFEQEEDGTFIYSVEFDSNETINIQPANCGFIERIQFKTTGDVETVLLVKPVMIRDLEVEYEGGVVLGLCEVTFEDETNITDIEFRLEIDKVDLENNDLDVSDIALYRINDLSDASPIQINAIQITSTGTDVYYQSNPAKVSGLYFTGNVPSAEEEQALETQESNDESGTNYIFIVPIIAVIFLLVIGLILVLMTARKNKNN